MKKNKPDISKKSSQEKGENNEGILDNSVIVSDSLNISQTSTGSTPRLNESKMGETTAGNTNESTSAGTETEVTSSELRKKRDGFFGAGQEIPELAKGSSSPARLRTSTGSSDGQMALSAAPSSGRSSVVITNIASTANTKNNVNISLATEKSETINSNLSSIIDNQTKSQVPDSPSSCIPDKSSNERFELPLRGGNNDCDINETRENCEGEHKTVSVITIVRDNKALDSRTTFGNSARHKAHLSRPNKSGEINQQGEIFSSASTDNPPMSINVREVTTTDIPQSLSTDSGIGSPLDVRTCIDSSPGQEMKLGQDVKWEMENYSLSSLAPGVVVPNFKGRSGSYPPCESPRDSMEQASSVDTSNYPPSAVQTSGESFRSSTLPKQESHSGDSLTSSEQRDLRLKQTISPYEKDPAVHPIATPLHDIPQNSGKPEDIYVSFSSKHSIDTRNRSVEEIADTGGIDSGQLPNTRPLDSSSESINSRVCTFQTSEFTVECESGHSNCENRNQTISQFCVAESGSQPAPSDSTGTCNNWQLLGKLTHLNQSKDAARKYSSEIRKENISSFAASSDTLPPGRKVKGILKTTSAPILGECRDKAGTLAELTNGQGQGEAAGTSRSVSFNQTHVKSTFSYNNVAFEGEIITEPSKRASLVEVVNQIMRHGTVVEMDEDNSHPYGRDNSLTDLMTGKHRDHYKMDAGKMIVWLALAIMIVSLAGGIIFMSETYNMNHRDEDTMIPGQDTTTPESHN